MKSEVKLQFRITVSKELVNPKLYPGHSPPLNWNSSTGRYEHKPTSFHHIVSG